MEQTEDALATEGTVRYDILFTLRLPGEPEPILIIVNVELQNLAWLGYPLIARGIFYAARLLGQQGPNYDSLHKVYSIWIVSNPPKAEENSIVSYSIIKKVLIREAACVSAKAQERQEQDDGALPGIPEAEELSDAKPAKTEHVNTETSAEPQVILHESAGGAVWRLEPLEEKADLMEVIFLNLGELDAERDPEHPTVLGLLDVLFSGSLGADEIKKILKTTFDIPVTKEMKEDMETMGDNRFAFEVKAEERGFRRGEIKGRNKLLFAQVRDKILSVAEAAKYTEVPEAVFEAEMLEYEAVQTSAG
ncbi:MAG: hypothetical protein HDQ87_01160 [Clostridia bacterium]|nr:hypothetical protein [Clostridia bacterium]